jgi:hypothetical protein
VREVCSMVYSVVCSAVYGVVCSAVYGVVCSVVCSVVGCGSLLISHIEIVGGQQNQIALLSTYKRT